MNEGRPVDDDGGRGCVCRGARVRGGRRGGHSHGGDGGGGGGGFVFIPAFNRVSEELKAESN